ncbi:MAG: hypothetical protein Q9198_009998 [Flavoplaca austrocitrina]
MYTQALRMAIPSCICYVLIFLALLWTPANASSTPDLPNRINPRIPTKHVHRSPPIANGVDLRILPLGDSITFGMGSSDGNGYRLILSNLISKDGNKLRYIGSVKSGSMPNNNHEGWRGFQIGPIGHKGRPTYPQRPNVVLLMAGTNDILMADDVENAPQRLEGLIGEMNVACPDAAILVATIPVLNHPITNPNLTNEKPDAYNAAMKAGIEKSAKDGKHVALVNMSGVTPAQIHGEDGVHPTDEGYALIAAAWYESLIAAGNKGWIQDPWSESSQDSSTTPSPQNDKNLVDNHVNTTDDNHVNTIDDHHEETTDDKHGKPSNDNPGKATGDNRGKSTANDEVNMPTDNHIKSTSDAINAPQTLGYQQLLIAMVSFLVLGWAARKAVAICPSHRTVLSRRW